ncbi:hypothetical protein ACFYNX_26195 [Streptomyces sp. NPDC007872]|uniref:hypothetical protein n=1 Tax=Streptomyces sp. NPDC007872 TaxID=3364782 RepID=UPI0036C3C27A
MSDKPSPGPAFTEIKLTGPADEVARLMRLLSGVGEVIYGPVTQPHRAGDVLCTAQLVTHPSPDPMSAGQSTSLTVQVGLEVGPGALTGLPGTAAAEQVEQAVVAAVSALPGVRGASGRLVAAVGLPPTRE